MKRESELELKEEQVQELMTQVYQLEINKSGKVSLNLPPAHNTSHYKITNIQKKTLTITRVPRLKISERRSIIRPPTPPTTPPLLLPLPDDDDVVQGCFNFGTEMTICDDE